MGVNDGLLRVRLFIKETGLLCRSETKLYNAHLFVNTIRLV